MKEDEIITRLVDFHDRIEAPDTPPELDALRGQRLVRRRRTGSVLAAAAAVALAVGIVQVTLSDGQRSQEPAPPLPSPTVSSPTEFSPSEWLTEPVLAPSSLSALREYGFHVAPLPGFVPKFEWELTADGQATWVRWVKHDHTAYVQVFYQRRYPRALPDSAVSVDVHGARGYYVEADVMGQPRGHASLLWEYAPDSWAAVDVDGGLNGQTLPAEPETRAALLAIAEAVGQGGPEVRLPFRLDALPASFPAANTAWTMSVGHHGGARWGATLELGDRSAAPTVAVISGQSYPCRVDIDVAERPEKFSYGGFQGCLVREATQADPSLGCSSGWAPRSARSTRTSVTTPSPDTAWRISSGYSPTSPWRPTTR